MLRVADVMTRYVEFLDPATSVREAATVFGELDLGAMPVGTETRLEGVVTDRDILYRITAAGLSGDTPVAHVMSAPVIGCMEDDSVQVALDSMAAHHIRRMPVRAAGSEAVIGWVTLGDLARKLLVDNQTLQHALRDLTEATA